MENNNYQVLKNELNDCCVTCILKIEPIKRLIDAVNLPKDNKYKKSIFYIQSRSLVLMDKLNKNEVQIELIKEYIYYYKLVLKHLESLNMVD